MTLQIPKVRVVLADGHDAVTYKFDTLEAALAFLQEKINESTDEQA